MAGDAGHMTCTLEVVGSNVNDHIRAHEGKAFSTNTIRTLLSILCAGRPSSAATRSRQRRPRRGGSSPSSRPCGGPFAFRRPPPRCRRPPRPSEACRRGSCSISPGHQPPIRGYGGGRRRRRVHVMCNVYAVSRPFVLPCAFRRPPPRRRRSPDLRQHLGHVPPPSRRGRGLRSAPWEEDDAIVARATYEKSLVFGRISPHSSTTIAPFAHMMRGLYPTNVDVRGLAPHLHELRIRGMTMA